jgi:hypothetical protein
MVRLAKKKKKTRGVFCNFWSIGVAVASCAARAGLSGGAKISGFQFPL